MTQTTHLLVFSLDDRRYALPLSVVERVVRAVEVTSVPDAPTTVKGLINVQGEVMPAIDMRGCLGLPEREVRLSDHLIVIRSDDRAAALMVDQVSGDLEALRGEDEAAGASSFGPHAPKVIKMGGRIVPVQDVERLLAGCDCATLATTEAPAGEAYHAAG